MRSNKSNPDARQLDPVAWAKDKMKRFGWYIHFVPNDKEFPNDINFHTHGIAESFGHPDLQICFPLPQQVAHQILHHIVDEIKQGKTFEPGRKYGSIIAGNLNVEFIDAMEFDRPVFRIVFPNKEGNYEGEMFTCQFEKTRI